MMDDFVKRPDPPVLYDPFRDIRIGPVRDAEELLQMCWKLQDHLICW